MIESESNIVFVFVDYIFLWWVRYGLERIQNELKDKGNVCGDECYEEKKGLRQRIVGGVGV